MKTTEEIYQTLLAAFAQRAGFTPEADCDLAVRLYAAAAELQALGIQSEWVLDQSFPQTARGVYLDYHAQMRGIARTAATKAATTGGRMLLLAFTMIPVDILRKVIVGRK